VGFLSASATSLLAASQRLCMAVHLSKAICNLKWPIWRNDAFMLHFAAKNGKLHQKHRSQNLCFLKWPRKSSSHLSGKICPLHIWIKPGKSGQNIIGMFVTYFDCEGTVHQYLSLKAKMLTRITTERLCNLWRRKSPVNVDNNGGTRMVGSPWQCTGTKCFASATILRC